MESCGRAATTKSVVRKLAAEFARVSRLNREIIAAEGHQPALRQIGLEPISRSRYTGSKVYSAAFSKTARYKAVRASAHLALSHSRPSSLLIYSHDDFPGTYLYTSFTVARQSEWQAKVRRAGNLLKLNTFTSILPTCKMFSYLLPGELAKCVQSFVEVENFGIESFRR